MVMTGASVYNIADYLRKPMAKPKQFQVEWYNESESVSVIFTVMAQNQEAACKRIMQTHGLPLDELSAILVWDGE